MQLKPSALAGWTLFLILMFLTIFYEIAALGISGTGGDISYLILGVTEVLVFLGPTVFLKKYRPLHGLVSLRAKMVPRNMLSFTLCASLALLFAAFLLGCACTPGRTPQGLGGYYPLRTGLSGGHIGVAVVALAVLPAIMEEMFLRGCIFSLYEKRGAATALILSSLAFAMLQTSPEVMLPTLALGVGCGFLLMATGSLYAPICAHLLHNLYMTGITVLAARFTYGVFWQYFIAANVIAFFFFAYLSVRILRNLVREDSFELPSGAQGSLGGNIKGGANTTGFMLFCALFLVRFVLSLLKANF